MITKIDLHMNIFKNYDDKYWLENNITRAFLLTFKMIKTEKKLEMLKEFKLVENLDELEKHKENLEFLIYLQKKPNIEVLNEIKNLKERFVRLFAFSPTGEAWNPEILSLDDIKNPDSREKNIKKLSEVLVPNIADLENNDEDLYKNEIKKVENYYNEIVRDHINRGGSIPDGWILIKVEGQIKNAIILENKKWHLDPHQLKNHIVKTLNKEYKNDFIRFKKYTDIYKFFSKCVTEQNRTGDIFVLDFLEYLTLLGYEPIDDDFKILTDDENYEDEKSKFVSFNNITKEYMYKKINNIIEEKYQKYKYKKSLNQLYPGVDDDNINIFYDVYIKSNELIVDISSEIGVRYKDYNIKLIDKMKKNSVKELERIYNNCIWCRFYKIGQIAGVKYLSKEDYKCLSEYLKEVPSSEMVYRRLSKQEIIKEFFDYKDYFESFNDSKKGVLEYLRIVSRKKYTSGDIIKYGDLKNYIIKETNKHIEGLKCINKLKNT